MLTNYTAIIQARSTSTRLPGKVLLKIAGKTILEHIVTRVQAAKLVSQVIVATSVQIDDLAIVKWCATHMVRVFCGSLDDVLDRYYQTARLFSAQNIIRITADCPLIDPRLIDTMIKFHKHKKVNYVANILEETFPDGEDIEIFTFTALEKAWKQAQLPSEREHVTLFIRKHPELYSLANYRNKKNLSKLRWTVDEENDLVFIKNIFNYLYRKNNLFGINDIIGLLKERPGLLEINQHIIRNEGYLKSLLKDKTYLNQN
jgi:spore coat polysaccharide biosynthesis protein SpsF (cytidylyltransferase family)